MTRRFDVCVLGSANLDLVADAVRIPAPGETVLGTNFTEHAGGKGLNQAVAAARSGASTTFIGSIGPDSAGEALMKVLEADQIDTTWLTRSLAATGRALIVVDSQAENSIVVVPGANADVVVPNALPIARVLLAQLEVPLAAVVEAFRLASLDNVITILNPAPATGLPDELIAYCDYVVPNQHEVDLLGGPGSILSRGCKAVVVTSGAAGAEIFTTEGQVHVPPFTVASVDSTGAGDAFCGAMAARLAAGDDLLEAVKWASGAGALATTVRGAVPAQPTAAAIRRLIDAGATSTTQT